MGVKAISKFVWFVYVLLVFHMAECSVISKKGRCPKVEESDRNCHREFVSECLVDFDCNGTAKCCRIACHQYKCVEPNDERKRICYRLSDLAFVLDASGSIGQDSFEKSKIMVKKLVQTFPPEKGYRHAAVVYGKKPFVEFNFISSANNRLKTSDLLERITRIPYYKSTMTRIDAALRLVKKKVFPGDKDLKARKKILVVITDGIQNTPPYKEGLAKAGKELEKNRVKVFAVVTGKQINIKTLLQLCTNDKLLFKQQFLSEMIKVMNAEMEYSC